MSGSWGLHVLKCPQGASGLGRISVRYMGLTCTRGRRETEAGPWSPPYMLIPWEWEEEANPPCPNAGNETLEKLLA